MPDRIVMLFDLDYFYVQVEENRNPKLEDRPIVVGMYSGRTERSGAVATASYEAREYGVHAGMPLPEAYRRLEDVEDAEFLEPDFDEYERVSGEIMDILREHASAFEQISIDEAWIEVGDRAEDFSEAEELARKIKEEIEEKVDISSSVGIGPNKLIAKMAADLDKPDGLSLVREDEFLEVFGDMETEELYGVGPKTAEKLEGMGIETIEELAEADPRELREEFGEKLGLYFHEAANGRDDEPVEEDEPQQFGRIVTLEENTREISDFDDILQDLSEKVVERAKNNGYEFRRVGILGVMEDIDRVTRSTTLKSHTQDPEVVNEKARELFRKLLDEDDREIRRVGIHVMGLRDEEAGLEKFF